MIVWRSLWFALLCALIAVSCADKERKKSGGSGEQPEPRVEDAIPEDDETDDVGPVVTGATARTLEECQAENRAWIAVVDNGNSPATCGDQLAEFCCQANEILNRFPNHKSEINSRIEPEIDKGLQIYACSKASDNDTTIHLAKIEDGKTTYKNVQIQGVFETDTGFSGSCQTLSTDDLTLDAPEEDEDDDKDCHDGSEDEGDDEEGDDEGDEGEEDAGGDDDAEGDDEGDADAGEEDAGEADAAEGDDEDGEADAGDEDEDDADEDEDDDCGDDEDEDEDDEEVEVTEDEVND